MIRIDNSIKSAKRCDLLSRKPHPKLFAIVTYKHPINKISTSAGTSYPVLRNANAVSRYGGSTIDVGFYIERLPLGSILWPKYIHSREDRCDTYRYWYII